MARAENDVSGADSEQPTRVDVPSRRSEHDTGDTASLVAPRTASNAPSSSRGVTTAATPADAIRQAEMARTRIFIPYVVGFALIVLSVVPFLGGHPTAKIVLAIGVLVAIGAVLYLYRQTSDEERYTDAKIGAVYFVSIGGIYCTVYYFGLYSPAPAVIVLGLFFVGIGRGTRVASALYATTAAYHVALSALIVSGAAPDYGLLRADELSVAEQVLIQGLLGLTMLVTFLVAVATKRQSEKAIVELDQAVRAIAQRDALLLEAREELDRAMQVGGPGRFTDQTLGSFRLGAVIGRGAMGEIYEAVHVESGAAAAVKLVLPSALSDPRQLIRFLREARIVATLRSPHVVRLLEVGDESATLPYLAMERLHGHDLAHELREKRKLSLARVVALVEQVADGIEAAREAGVVHRDLKPPNLFLDSSGGGAPVWKILDFGVSKLEDHQGTLTRGHVVGTPMYMAPEQARGDDVDHRADVYALTAVAYRALTGHPPFAGRDVPAILHSVVYELPQRPRDLVSAPADVERVLRIGLAKHPADRFETARELADAFAAAAAGRLDPALRRRADELARERPWRAHA